MCMHQKIYPTPKSWFLPFFSKKRNVGSMEKWQIPGLGHGIYKINLGYLVVPKNKAVLNNNNHNHLH